MKLLILHSKLMNVGWKLVLVNHHLSVELLGQFVEKLKVDIFGDIISKNLLLDILHKSNQFLVRVFILSIKLTQWNNNIRALQSIIIID